MARRDAFDAAQDSWWCSIAPVFAQISNRTTLSLEEFAEISV
jgi:hypothetical protein